MDANSFLKRIVLLGLISALPTFVQAAPPGGGHFGHGGSSGGHFAPAAHSGFHGSWNGGHWNGHGSWNGGHWNGGHWSGPGSWNGGHWNGGHWNGHGDWHGHGWHHHDQFSFGFFPYWYPGWGYYDYYGYYGYPYYGGYYDDYPDYPASVDRSGASLDAFVQDGLARRGYYDGQVDGVIGPQTRSAIREFQNDNNLPVTGRIDARLVHALRSS